MDAIMWLRRDLRIEDNHALYRALMSHKQVQVIFIFDTDILGKLDDPQDARVSFIHETLTSLHAQLQKFNARLWLFYGKPQAVFSSLCDQYSFEAVYANHDYEPQAIERDDNMTRFLLSRGKTFQTFKDQVIFEKDEVLKPDGSPYTVFTPYSRKWKARLEANMVQIYPCDEHVDRLHKTETDHWLNLKDIGFEPSNIAAPQQEVDLKLISNYAERRDYPAVKGTSRLSVHLRFGTISIRKLMNVAIAHSETWMNELIWREFYQMILWHFPHSVEKSFKSKYDYIEWRHDEKDFDKWCKGETGYPLVDAGMRELNTTGFMHNRVRMVVASFLCKHLLLPWKWGERYFAAKLLDFDLASNVGGWQWAAGTGCDAAPYFRVFNPELQWKKFDPDNIYVNRWVPEFQDPFTYPKPMVEHSMARDRAIERYKTGLSREAV